MLRNINIMFTNNAFTLGLLLLIISVTSRVSGYPPSNSTVNDEEPLENKDVPENDDLFGTQTTSFQPEDSPLPQSSPPPLDNAPTLQENSPSQLDNSPPLQENSPSQLDNSPPLQENSPSQLYNSPPLQENSPSQLDNSPPLQESSPSSLENSPTLPENYSSQDNTSPSLPEDSFSPSNKSLSLSKIISKFFRPNKVPDNLDSSQKSIMAAKYMGTLFFFYIGVCLYKALRPGPLFVQ